MNFVRKIAQPCGITGGVWGLLAPVLVILPISVQVTVSPVTGEQGQKEMVSMVEAGTAGDVLPILSFLALMGVLGLLAIVLSKRWFRLSRIFLWVSASAILAVSLITFGLGLYFIPAAILLILAAVGLKREEKFRMEEKQ